MRDLEIALPRQGLTAIGTVERSIAKGSSQVIEIPQHETDSKDTSVIGGQSHWMARRRLLLAGLTVVIGSGIALNWGWLTAVGLTPILVSLAPCGVMCGLGNCMKGGAGTRWWSRPTGVFR
jgi:hypothetical protein